MLAAFNHPGIGAIHEVGCSPARSEEDSDSAEGAESDDIHYIVMECVPGETVAERLARGDFSTDDALDVARQLAEALELAHEQGIARRDLKPANIKINSSGRVKILDFGRAKSLTLAKTMAPLKMGESSKE